MVRRCVIGAVGPGGRDERACKECLEPIYVGDAVLYCEACGRGFDEGQALTT